MNDKEIKGVIQILKSQNKNKLAEYLSKSNCIISESGSYGTLMHSVISTLEIYSPIKKHALLCKISEDEKKDIFEAVLKIFPPKSNSPEITDIMFINDPKLDSKSIENQILDDDDFDRFWEAFKSIIDEILHEYGGFDEFSMSYEHTIDGNGYFAIDTNKINRKMIQEIGFKLYPLKEKPSVNILIKLIEFFFKYSKTPNGDRGKATYQFTIKINELFKRFNIPYKLKKGKVLYEKSIVLDKIFDLDILNIQKKDIELFKLLNESVKFFCEPIHLDIDTALEKIANALERVKTLMEPSNKKESIKQTIESLTNDEIIRDILNNHLKDLTFISNNYSIRHKEKNKKAFDSNEIKEYLFYEYYNIIRFILLLLNNKD